MSTQCTVFSAIMSQLFPFRDRLYIYDCQGFALVPQPDDNHRVVNSPDIIAVIEGFLVTKLHATENRFLITTLK